MAVTLTERQLADATGIDDVVAARLLAVAAALVDRYAPLAPAPVANEAAIRTAAYIHGQPSAAIRSETEGDVETEYAATHLSALRHSGGMALLSPWKIRRGGAI